ncbi:alpha-2-macroglobulin-like protein 1 isoform X1 [Alosa sapidissima]|uniref:alpha-2-macroglobulin-like protein 1 isoform X1 n=3 Tax=Alosa sapidissima TaxID=34773 RepID=UPI001C0818BD|nr:alpha-2-macroglobulin-like protein 1 isoform X1 [Alosa sapidissima]
MFLWRICTALGLLAAVGYANPAPRPSFLVTFPASINSGSHAKVCVSFLKPSAEPTVMSIYLNHKDNNTLLLQEPADTEFHRCFQIQAPVVMTMSVQKIRVEVKGQTFNLMEERKVLFNPKPAPITFIQTDKPIYTPGQTVHFRVISLDTKFIAVNGEYPVVELKNSGGTRIGQWLNYSSQGQILALSHTLSSEAPEGAYFFYVYTNQDHATATHGFRVKKYVLPKFEVTTDHPFVVSVGLDVLELKVCGKYTYGLPVPGLVLMVLCRHARAWMLSLGETLSPLCLNASLEMGDSGCASHVFNMTFFTDSGFATKLDDALDFNATVIEEETEVSKSITARIWISYSLGSITFEETPNVYEYGSVVEGKIRMRHFNGTSVAYKPVYLYLHAHQEPLMSITTDSDGLASFSFHTAALNKDNILLFARVPFYDQGIFWVTLHRNPSQLPASHSSLYITSPNEPLKCHTVATISIRYVFTGETFTTDTVDIIYLVLSNGEIVHHGFVKAPIKITQTVVEGQVSFELPVTPEMANFMDILVYCVFPSEMVLAKSKRFQTEKCFRSKVSVQFSPPKAVPGEESSLQLSAPPGSLCGISAVDQSIFILEKGSRLDANMMFGMAQSQFRGIPSQVQDRFDCLHLRPRRSSMAMQTSITNDAHSVFGRLGLKVASDLHIRTPSCVVYRGHQYTLMGAGEYDPPVAAAVGVAFNPAQTIRTFFPETWIWELTEVGESGEARVPLTVPDTITTWETEAFCLSPQGFGLAPPVQLTVFQPFFLELSLPYSIIRGETFELKATVFNYQPKCIMVTVTPAPSSDFTLTPSSDGQYSSCLCANVRKTFKWTLVPSVLGVMNVTVSAEAAQSQTLCDNQLVTVPERGRIDTVTRQLLVKAEGSQKTESYNWLLCPKGGALTEEVELKLPAVVVMGSARGSVSVLGDILGRALKNIGTLLQMPFGCGEQNMAILSPNIYILQYLQNTGQLTADIKEKATNFLKSGYQRQLNYKHRDGAYSTFGRGDGNTWLTSFVLRSFGKAKSFIYIDPTIILDAKNWLESRLQPDGVFHMQGKLFHNRMKGGVNDVVTITAYVTASMLELNISVTEKTLTYLKSSVSDLSNTYTTALLAYTFSLVGEEDIRAELLKHLDSVATSEGSLLHWSQSSSERADSLAVEMSSYVLLAVLTKPTLTVADLGYASRIVSWLVKQQNPYGGFSSTQDTVVALQALALYATKVFSPHGSSTVTVQSAGGDKHQFDVNQHNTLLYQETALQNVPGKYSVEVTGSACASVGVALFYNIPTPTEHSTLSITIQARPLTEGECNKVNGQAFTLNITIQYHGSQESTNMAIIDVKMLSGFTADSASVERLQGGIVDRVDKKGDHILVYLSQVPKGYHFYYGLILRQDHPVSKLKPALAKVYDYYQPSDQAETEYSSPCVA